MEQINEKFLFIFEYMISRDESYLNISNHEFEFGYKNIKFTLDSAEHNILYNRITYNDDGTVNKVEYFEIKVKKRLYRKILDIISKRIYNSNAGRWTTYDDWGSEYTYSALEKAVKDIYNYDVEHINAKYRVKKINKVLGR